MLNDLQIKRAKPQEKAYKLTDGDGLFLLITPAGGKLWRWKYRFNGQEKLLSIGKYPQISLVQARQATEIARKQLANGISPADAKQHAKAESKKALLNNFEAVARKWHNANLNRWKAHNASRILSYLEKDVFVHIGKLHIDEIKAKDIQSVLDKLVQRNATSTAEKIRQWLASIFTYANRLELTERNPALLLRGTIIQAPTKHRKALPASELTPFYIALIRLNTQAQSRIAMLLIMLLFPRSTEFRGGKWVEVDFDNQTWIIPSERMKHEKTKPKPPLHIPLSDWAIVLLRELYELTGNTPYLFPSRTATDGVISEATLNRMIERMGFMEMATPHGFRSLASSTLNEQGFNADAIERQLSHVPNDKIRSAYNHAEYWHERVEFMQWYSDYLKAHYDEAMKAIEAD